MRQEAARRRASRPPSRKPTRSDQPAILAPEPRSAGGAKGVTEFRTERWEEIYGKRIDETIAALKSKGVPVIWVGLPAIRGTRSTADVQYLNDLYRARAEKAGIVYVDVWDGFVDEAGKFTTRGPDFEGQVRSLRAGDGVHFTKYGARKIAHYVERELRRFIANKRDADGAAGRRAGWADDAGRASRCDGASGGGSGGAVDGGAR